MKIDKLPGVVYWVVFSVIYAGLQAFVVAQWPEVQPAWVIGIMTGLGVLAGLLKVLWPTPPVTPQDAPATARGMAIADTSTAPTPSKVNKFLF